MTDADLSMPQLCCRISLAGQCHWRKVRCKKCGTVFEIAVDDGLEFDDLGEAQPAMPAVPNRTQAGNRRPNRSTGPKSGSKAVVWVAVGVGFGVLLLAGAGAAAWKVMRTVQTATSRVKSSNNLKQMALALHMYHDAHVCFPPGAIADANGKLRDSWQTSLLPYVEGKRIYDGINFNVPWDDPMNAASISTQVSPYLNPIISRTKDERGYALSHYAGNSQIFYNNSRVRIRDIKDGTSNTLMGGEVAEGFEAWGNPINMRDPALGLNKGPETFGGPGGKQTQFMLVDGSVKTVSSNIDPAVLKALATPRGGEVVPDDVFAP